MLDIGYCFDRLTPSLHSLKSNAVLRQPRPYVQDLEKLIDEAPSK